ncbi:MAG: glycosyltransferase family 39 protein [Kiritimatiellaeota bacterium]|nr:glycosyltransferase family 39 protein [Kiritimatiellota bacterium]
MKVKILHSPFSILHSKSPPTAATLLAFVILLWGVQSILRGFWEPDEARFVYVANEMAADGHFFVPFRSGVFYAHKPPLLFWLMNFAALPFRIFGAHNINGFAARFPSLIGAFLSLLATSRIAAKLGGAKAAWRAVVVLSTTFLFWQVNSMGQQDALLTGFIMCAIALLWNDTTQNASAFSDAIPTVLHGSAYRPIPNIPYRKFLAGLCMGLGTLLKGPPALVVPALALVAMRFASSKHKFQFRNFTISQFRNSLISRFRNFQLSTLNSQLSILLGVLIPPAIWLIGAYFENPPDGYFHEILFKQTVERAGGGYGHLKGPFYFIRQFPLEFLPWTLVLPFAWRTMKSSPNRKTLSAWFFAVIIFFSIIPTKRNLYILATYPAAAILVALAWDDIQAKLQTIIRLRVSPDILNRAAAVFLALFFLAGVVVYPIIEKYKTPVGIRETVAPYLASDSDDHPRLALVGTNGEIYALYAGVKGITFLENDNELENFSDYIAANGHGAAVVGTTFWKTYGSVITRTLTRENRKYKINDLRVGNKRGDKSDKLVLWREL